MLNILVVETSKTRKLTEGIIAFLEHESFEFIFGPIIFHFYLISWTPVFSQIIGSSLDALFDRGFWFRVHAPFQLVSLLCTRFGNFKDTQENNSILEARYDQFSQTD